MSRQRSYSPIRVKNPSSLHHMIRVQPGQEINIRLDLTAYPNSKVSTSGGNLHVVSEAQVGDVKCFIIAHKEQVKDWARYSTCFIGEIWVESDFHCAHLEVMLECHTLGKGSFVTVINPDCVDVRYKAHEVMEVILFDENFGNQDEWSWSWSPLMDIGVELMGYTHLSLNLWKQHYEIEEADEPQHAYARFPRAEAGTNPWCRQHHLWFRFDEKILEEMHNLQGVHHVGDFWFHGYGEIFRKHVDQPEVKHLSVHVDFSTVKTNLVRLTLAMPKLSETEPPVPGSCRPLTAQVLRQSKLKPKVPVVREVFVSLKDEATLEAGCKTIPAEPPEEVPDQHPDCGDCSLVPYNNRHSPFGHHPFRKGLGMMQEYDDDPYWWYK